MGENGAGKSTLIRRSPAPDRSTPAASARRDEVRLDLADRGQRHGIRTVYQELDLLPNLSVAREHHARPRAAPFRHDRLAPDAARGGEVLRGLGLDIDPISPLSVHSLAVQQLVAIARAISTMCGCSSSMSRRRAWMPTRSRNCSG
jgi:simple sugar transport system ATP-binding protein